MTITHTYIEPGPRYRGRATEIMAENIAAHRSRGYDRESEPYSRVLWCCADGSRMLRDYSVPFGKLGPWMWVALGLMFGVAFGMMLGALSVPRTSATQVSR